MPSLSTSGPALSSFAAGHWFLRRPRGPESLSLVHGRSPVASLQVHRPLRILCTAGSVWLTCEGDIRDHVLEAGAAYEARPGESLVLLGMPSATVLVSPG